MIEIISTQQAAMEQGVKLAIYGESGVGKTTLASTAEAPLLLSAESGELSLRKFNLPMIRIKTMAQLIEAFNFVTKAVEANQFRTIILDSVSEVGEVVLADRLAKCKDPRMAYGELNTMMIRILKDFRDIRGKHVVILAKEESFEINPGQAKFYPMMPGKKLGPQMPYLFDEVFWMARESKIDPTTGVYPRFFLTDGDWNHYAKDRSGALAVKEAPHLGYIINKIQGA